MATSPINLYAPYKERIDLAVGNKLQANSISRATIKLSAARVGSLAAVDGQE